MNADDNCERRAINERGPIVPVVSTREATYCHPDGTKLPPPSDTTGEAAARLAAAKAWDVAMGVSR